MDDGGPGQTKGVVKEETRGEVDGEAWSAAREGCGQGGDPGGKWTGKARRDKGVAKEETQGENGRGGAWRGQGGGVAIQGTKGDGRRPKNLRSVTRGVSVLIWTDDRACDLAPLP